MCYLPTGVLRIILPPLSPSPQIGRMTLENVNDLLAAFTADFDTFSPAPSTSGRPSAAQQSQGGISGGISPQPSLYSVSPAVPPSEAGELTPSPSPETLVRPLPLSRGASTTLFLSRR